MAVKPRVPKTENGAGAQKLISPQKLSLACGMRKPEGYFGVDLHETEQTDFVMDLLSFPWPIKTNSVRELECAHFVEHIPHWRPGYEMDGFWHFIAEVYRICRKDATCLFVHPYVMNGRAFWDPTHERYIHEATWTYLDRNWREREGLDHYIPDVHFETISIEGTGVPDSIQAKNHEAQAYARLHYWNVIDDIVVRLKVVK